MNIIRSMLCKGGSAPIECPFEVPLGSDSSVFATEVVLQEKETFDKFVSSCKFRVTSFTILQTN